MAKGFNILGGLIALVICTSPAHSQSQEEKLDSRLEQLRKEETQLNGELERIRSQIAELERAKAEVELEQLLSGATVLTATTKFEAKMYRDPTIESQVVATIPAGAEVKVLAAASSPFVEVVFQNQRGFVTEGHFDKTNPVLMKALEAQRGLHDSSTGSTASERSLSSSTSGSSSSSSATTSTRCLGTTQKGSRCKRITTDPSGYCWQHK